MANQTHCTFTYLLLYSVINIPWFNVLAEKSMFLKRNLLK